MKNLSLLFLSALITFSSCKKDNDDDDNDSNDNTNNPNTPYVAEFYVEALLDGQTFRVEVDEVGNTTVIYSNGGELAPGNCDFDYGSTIYSFEETYEYPGFGIHFNQLYSGDCDESEELAQFTASLFQNGSYSLTTGIVAAEALIEYYDVTCDGCSSETDQLSTENGSNSGATLSITSTETYTDVFGSQRMKVIGTFDNVTVYDDNGSNSHTFTNGTFSLSYAPYYD